MKYGPPGCAEWWQERFAAEPFGGGVEGVVPCGAEGMERVEFVRIRGTFIADVAGVLVDQLCQDGKGEAEVDCEKVRCA